MNLCDNGVSKVVGPIRRIVTDDELCFAVDVLDFYDKPRTIKAMTKTEIEKVKPEEYTWVE